LHRRAVSRGPPRIIEHARDMNKILRPMYSPAGGWRNMFQGK
jgi:hypothetical protein